jgi:hypothetical protein
MVRGVLVVSVPVVQAVAEEDATVNPAGKISVKETPVRDVALFGFVRVKVRVLVEFLPIDVGEKLFARFGAVGRAQPLMTMLSR